MKKLMLAAIILQSTFVFCQTEKKDFPILKSPYLGQKPPGMTPELFAPGIVSTGNHEHSSPVFTPDLKEMYWSTILIENSKVVLKPAYYMKLVNGVWSKPEIPSFAKNFPSCDNPFISPDGKRLFFAANDFFPPKDYDIYYVNRIGESWSEPIKLDTSINKLNTFQWQPTISKNGTIYFVGNGTKANDPYGLYYSKLENGKYEESILMEEKFNSPYSDWTPYIAPDESYFIFCSLREGGYGNGDLYICFKQKDGSWGKIINMGNKINTDQNDRFPNVSPDGKYLFFNRMPAQGKRGDSKDGPGNGWSDVYWVDARIIEELRPKE